jgi:ribosome silencing factor RsfS/YbeB/iojap
VPFEKKPSRSKPQKNVEDGAASAPEPKAKHSAGAKHPSKPRAARKSSGAPPGAAGKTARNAAGKTARKSAGKAARKSRAKSSGTPPGAAAPGVAKPGARPRARGLQTPAAALAALKSVVLGALDDMKALQVKVLDVRGLTDIADYMVIASGTSDRHVRSVAQRLVEKTKEAGYRPHGCEGLKDADWVLIDLHEMIVHIMLPRVREFYGLEKLWDMGVKRVAHA